MIATSSAIADCDPFTEPSWRWQAIDAIASQMNSQSRCSQPIDEDIQRLAAGFKLHGEFRDPAIHQAHAIFVADGILRAEIEARLLACESDTTIAAKTGVSCHAVSRYESLFFCVRDRLEATGWILGCAIGYGHLGAYQDCDLRQLWCYFAWNGGPIIADELIGTYQRIARRGDGCRLAIYLVKDADVRLELQAAIAQLVIPIDGVGAYWNLEFGIRCRKIESLSDAAERRQQFHCLQQAIVDCGRMALSGRPLPKPQNWADHLPNKDQQRRSDWRPIMRLILSELNRQPSKASRSAQSV